MIHHDHSLRTRIQMHLGPPTKDRTKDLNLVLMSGAPRSPTGVLMLIPERDHHEHRIFCLQSLLQQAGHQMFS